MKQEKNYILISGFGIHDSNRGTAALGYGSISFLEKYHNLTPDTKIVNIRYVKKIWKKKYRSQIEQVKSGDKKWNVHTIFVLTIEKWLYEKFNILLPFTPFGKIIKHLNYVAAINGGDGFSDIYSTATFHSRLDETLLAIKKHIPTIQLPQTMGPFNENSNYIIAEQILKSAKYVYVRDDKFVTELEKMGVKYKIENDLSFYMQPETWDFKPEPHAIGLNISGLAYSNRFRTLSGQFDTYPYLCTKIVEFFQSINRPIYLISHSYNYQNPEEANDDMVAARDFYSKLKNKQGVHLIDKDLNSPQTKYLISCMSFFIGTRMHANFAAIFTKVPLFGLAYSYKFEGAFNKNGIYNQTAMINNISKQEAKKIVEKISKVYQKYKS